MIEMLRDFFSALTRLRVYVGVDPARVSGPAIILFPVLRGVLFCGLVGFVVVKKDSSSHDPDMIGRMRSSVEAICKRGFSSGSGGRIEPGSYLSPDDLDALSRDVARLKQDSASQHAHLIAPGPGALKEISDRLHGFLMKEEAAFEARSRGMTSSDLETVAARLVSLKDVEWSLREDIMANHDRIVGLAGDRTCHDAAYFERFQKVNACLNALNRLEVRGRDSAGLQIQLAYPGPGTMAELRHRLTQEGLFDEFVKRCMPHDLMNRSIHVNAATISFTYKTAQVTGALGENTARLRKAIGSDMILREAMALQTLHETYLGHTRWASVGAINEINCHPVNNHRIDIDAVERGGIHALVRDFPRYGKGAWSISAALNGDIDNYLELRERLENGRKVIHPDITTDTKIIPMLVEHHLAGGETLEEAFRKSVAAFEGSHAIALLSDIDPGRVYLGQKGSGQSIYVGFFDGGYMFASEVYGLVEVTPSFVKMDGESMRQSGDPATQGQIFILDAAGTGGIGDIRALSYDGYPLHLGEEHIQTAQITTRDIDRGDHQHYLIKEILDAPSSIRKTLLGKYRIEDAARVVFNLDETVVDAATRRMISAGEIRNIFVVGQGTAAVAAGAVAEAMSRYLRGAPVFVQARKATDLSGFLLDDDMSDTLVIAITQSGTTTDTNRAVTLARSRGARLIAIVNRRQSDITTKVHGVFYTSDGRDVEMSVASTKAFYSQIAAGYVLALFFAQLTRTLDDGCIAENLRRLEDAPGLMARVIGQREAIGKTAWDVVRRKQYWAVVGSGINKVASDEVRIKLSELCYKTISSDIIEDKKHIDLSSEPLILVCCAGSPKVVLEDIVKDVAIFKAHEASVVVVTDEGEHARFDGVADGIVEVPCSDFPLCVILNTLAGHIWGYYAALSLDEQARTFKRFRSSLEEIASEHRRKEYTVYESVKDRELHRVVESFEEQFKAWKSRGELSSLRNDVASDITLLLKYVKGKLPVEDFWLEFEGKRVSSSPLDMLDLCLKKAVEDLSRPVDAIRHQAKTVTVGTSRRMEAPRGPIFSVLEELGYTAENVRARDILTIKRLQDAVARVKGYTLYRVDGLDEDGSPTQASTLCIVRRKGISETMPSRYERPAPLRGTKNTIVRTRKVFAGTGRFDDASIVIIPIENAHRTISNLLLLQVDFDERLSARQKKDVLGVKLNDIVNLVNEYDVAWKDEYLDHLEVRRLLGEDVEVLVGILLDRLGVPRRELSRQDA